MFDKFDGRRWQRSIPINQVVNQKNNQSTVRSQAEKVSYEIILEPTGQHWLYGIADFSIENNNLSTIYTNVGEVFVKDRIDQRIKYVANSYKSAPQHAMAADEYQRLIALPDNINPETRKQAQQWYAESDNALDYINTVLDFYRSHFTYTLPPPKLGIHSVDEFLFQSQQGFCEHYASSLVVLMRSVGIPARVVVGYQGGRWNAKEAFLSVYQRDAHAWAEVWLQGSGWLRVDPTAAVSALRIEQGLEAALPESERQQLSHYATDYRWVKYWYGQWQTLNYRWQHWVLDYDAVKQKNLLQSLLGKVTSFKLALLLLIPLIIVALVLNIGLLLRYLTPLDREHKIINKVHKKLTALVVDKQPGETLNQYLQRASEYLPERLHTLQQLQLILETLFYKPEADRSQWDKADKIIRTL